MCGLVGIVRHDGQPVEQPVLEAMGRRLSHRGPDDSGSYLAGPVGFHHQRLAIIDLVTGHQPMTVGECTIVFNGEIYNYVELRDELARAGHRFSTSSDTEVIARLYLVHGEAAFARLNGIFALLIHDRAQRRLVAARDHLGVKPLYWWADERRRLYASEIKAFMAHPAFTAEADLLAVHEYLTFQFTLGDTTLFRGVRKLLPGHYQVVDLASGAVRTERYWEPRFLADFDHTEQYFQSELRRLLEDAARLQMRADVPVGAHLSGGLDSTIITMLASRHAAPPFHTFTGRFLDGPEFDEVRYARAVAESVRSEMHEVVCDAAGFVEHLPRLIYHLDEPAAGPGVYPQYMVSRLASQHVKVVLGGQGGDEIFGGYARYLVAYLEQALKGAIMETAEEAEHVVSLRSIVPNLPALRAYTPMLRQFWRAGLFEPMDRRYFRLVDRLGGALSLFTGDFRAGYQKDDLFGRFAAVFNHPDTRSYYNKMTHFDIATGLQALLHVEDRVSMAVSMETRVPLLDYRLVELVARMPPRLKFSGGELKYILRCAVRDVVPPVVMERKDKMGFPVPLHRWVSGEARDFVADTLLSRAARERGIADPAELEKLMGYEQPFSRQSWGLLCLELWFRTFVDRS